MRKPQNSRRGRGRNTGGRPMGNNRQQRRPQNPANRVYDSQGPDGRVKGTPAQLYERYKTAAREVQGGDRIMAESLLQFSDHYYRLSMEGQDQQQAAERQRHQDSEARQDDQPQELVAGREHGEPAAAEARPKPDGHRRSNGLDREEISSPDETEMPVTEEQIPVLRRGSRPKTKNAVEGAEAGMPAPAPDEEPKPRRRGRPRKADGGTAEAPAPESAAPEGEEQPKPRRRGRPRKTETVAETDAAS